MVQNFSWIQAFGWQIHARTHWRWGTRQDGKLKQKTFSHQKMVLCCTNNHYLWKQPFNKVSFITLSCTVYPNEETFCLLTLHEFTAAYVRVIFRQQGDTWSIHRGCNPRWMNHSSTRCLKITGLFFTWAWFQNCGIKQWYTILNMCSILATVQ